MKILGEPCLRITFIRNFFAAALQQHYGRAHQQVYQSVCLKEGGSEASVFSAIYHCDAIYTEAGNFIKIAKADVVATMQSNSAFPEGFTSLFTVQVQQYRAHIGLLAIPSAREHILAAAQADYFDATVTELGTRIKLNP